MKNVDGIFERIKEVLGAKNDTEVASALGIKQQSVTSARKRGKIPDGWITKIATDRSVSADWLLFGEGEKDRRDSQIKFRRNRSLEEIAAGFYPKDYIYPSHLKAVETPSELWDFYRGFAEQFLEKIYHEIGYRPTGAERDILTQAVADDILFELRPRFLNYMIVAKKVGLNLEPYIEHNKEDD